MEATSQILTFIHEAENIKHELRHSWTSKGRRESVAEHSWRLVLMLIACAPHISGNIDLLKALKMAIIHDLGEAKIGDMHYLDVNEDEQTRRDRNEAEADAINVLSRLLGTGDDQLSDLWRDFETRQSREARIVYFLDKLEACIQHNEANISTWTGREIDSIESYFDLLKIDDEFLMNLKERVKAETQEKLQSRHL